MARVRDKLPSAVSNVAGLIKLRQSTYWDLECGAVEHVKMRVHFVDKTEFHYASPTFVEAHLSKDHPVLVDYSEPNQLLFLSKSPTSPDDTLDELSRLVHNTSDDWRSLERYCNPLCDPLRVLRDGHGLLMSGPRTLISAAEHLLSQNGAQSKLLPGHVPQQELQVLSLGRNFVIAWHFDFEQIT